MYIQAGKHRKNVILKIIVSAITLVAIYIIFYVGIGLLWPLGTSTNYVNINNVLLNLSYSYIAALIFFVFYELFPSKNREEKALQLCEAELSGIYQIMSRMIAISKFFAGVDKDDSDILSSDLSHFNVVKPDYDRVYYCETIISNGEERDYKEYGCLSFNKDLYEQCKRLLKRVKMISNLPNSVYLNHELLSLLTKIELCKFVELFSHESNSFITGQPYGITGFDTGLIDFIEIHRKLEKYIFQKLSFHYYSLQEKEIAMVELERNMVVENLKSQGFEPQNQLFYLNHKRYKFRDGILY